MSNLTVTLTELEHYHLQEILKGCESSCEYLLENKDDVIHPDRIAGIKAELASAKSIYLKIS